MLERRQRKDRTEITFVLPADAASVPPGGRHPDGPPSVMLTSHANLGDAFSAVQPSRTRYGGESTSQRGAAQCWKLSIRPQRSAQLVMRTNRDRRPNG